MVKGRLPGMLQFDSLDPQVEQVHETWFCVLRWAAVLGQLATVAVAEMAFGVELPVRPLLAVIGLTALSNVPLTLALRSPGGAASWLGRHGATVRAAVILFDLVALTALLHLTGGPANPFAVFFLVNLGLAALLLRPAQAWAVSAVGLALFSALFFRHRPQPAFAEPGRLTGGVLTLGQEGQLFAFATCGGLVVYFVTLVTAELRQRNEQLRASDRRRADAARLQALGTLAAGAAHELSSPLGTVAVTVREIERVIDRDLPGSQVRGDIELIRTELGRCREILGQMSVGAGQAVGQQWHVVGARGIDEALRRNCRELGPVRSEFREGVERVRVRVPLQGVVQALRGIVHNAAKAGGAEPVRLRYEPDGDEGLRVWVIDRGRGMEADTLFRAAEPFFTTREPGEGMGLGLFLARNVIEGVGGRLYIKSEVGTGTSVTVTLPAELTPRRQ